ncbi:MAG: hypothetical protein Q9223_004570 [Gallowayella weberi]
MLCYGCYYGWQRLKPKAYKEPISVNYHFTRKCNYECGFCFHTAKTSYMLPIADAKRGLKLLVDAGMRKINFAGGEPFLYPEFLGKLVRYHILNQIAPTFLAYADPLCSRYCKEDLHMESVSIVTNGSLVKEKWLEQYAKYLDIMAVSCDSFDEQTNMMIGRGKGSHLDTFVKLSELCRKYKVMFKVNTVVCRYNIDEDMNDDEYMRFLNKGVKEPTKSILEIGVPAAMDDVYWDDESFTRRGGEYDWQKEEKKENPDFEF